MGLFLEPIISLRLQVAGGPGACLAKPRATLPLESAANRRFFEGLRRPAAPCPFAKTTEVDESFEMVPRLVSVLGQGVDSCKTA